MEPLGSITIKVDSEQLKTQATEAFRRLRKMKGLFEEAEAVISRTRSYWIGLGGDAHREAYFERREELQRMLRRLEDHPKNLLRISGNYEEAESELQDAVSQLRTDVIDY